MDDGCHKTEKRPPHNKRKATPCHRAVCAGGWGGERERKRERQIERERKIDRERAIERARERGGREREIESEKERGREIETGIENESEE